MSYCKMKSVFMEAKRQEEFKYDEESPWTIINSYFENQHLQRLVRHQIESYNDFINFQIQKTIDMFNPVNIVSEHFYNKEHNKYELEIEINF